MAHTLTPTKRPPLETRDMLLNVGPAHPAMHGIIRIITKLDGEQIVDIDVEIGYLHRGFEKMAETVDYNVSCPTPIASITPRHQQHGCYGRGEAKASRSGSVATIRSSCGNFRISDHSRAWATAMELGAFVFLYDQGPRYW